MMTNCPNCGAPIPGNGKCEYCGTICIASDHEVPVKVELDPPALVRELRSCRVYDPNEGIWKLVPEKPERDKKAEMRFLVFQAAIQDNNKEEQKNGIVQRHVR